MRSFLRENFAIVLAFSLPIALIAVVAAGVYLPSLFVSTEYDFVYSRCSSAQYYPFDCKRYLQQRYTVENGRLQVREIDPAQDLDKNGTPDAQQIYSVHFFLHDTERNQSKEITFEAAQMIELNNLLTSPDGVAISGDYDRGPGFFPFFGGGSSYAYYLTKGRSRNKLNLFEGGQPYYYPDPFHFLGWVMHE